MATSTLSSADKLSSLRSLLKESNLGGVIIPHDDEFMNEYTAPYAERLKWISHFSGSAGLAIVTQTHAALFSDGRYTLQMKQQVDPTLWETFHMTQTPPSQWLKTLLPAEALPIAYDPWLMTERALKPFQDAGLPLAPIDYNPIDRLWKDQPAYPHSQLVVHPLSYAGVSSESKRQTLAQTLQNTKTDLLLLTDPTNIAWLLNIRGHDIAYTPIALLCALFFQDGHMEVFTNKNDISPEIKEWVGKDVSFANRSSMADILTQQHHKVVQYDPATTSVGFLSLLRAAQAQLIPKPDPCLILKSCKNPIEQEGARLAHLKDGIALCRFNYWLHFLSSEQLEQQTEITAAAKLETLRKQDKTYQEDSFPAISAIGPQGAIIHYKATNESAHTLSTNALYLLDSGGQYLEGTTDVTRTFWLGNEPPPLEITMMYTLVLKGHIALASAHFPKGCTGSQLDSLARMFLWRHHADYDHGTGHGVGSYLSVHEGPPRISSVPSIPLQAGMILSNEPGYYQEGQYGIRLENLILVQEVPDTPQRPFLMFETLTLVPFDRRLINPTLLTAPEVEWLNTYHSRIFQTISPQLTPQEQDWLRVACEPITLS
ncbi:aminopeptidase family protein P [Entomobacter blattae]|uniref:Metallopeptidase family M24 n=1 Tax=Entomobacter blattae TaxID=2762277 RepID=A0A7H1NSA2_9PROT|nr:aminopeptidase family protein P [Entomobacter blattae]QNT78662.1 Metallopeptidase family M24 [Entomobacter blattae]